VEPLDLAFLIAGPVVILSWFVCRLFLRRHIPPHSARHLAYNTFIPVVTFTALALVLSERPLIVVGFVMASVGLVVDRVTARK
jgi:hypothetical protein